MWDTGCTEGQMLVDLHSSSEVVTWACGGKKPGYPRSLAVMWGLLKAGYPSSSLGLGLGTDL